jgi:hypothetical protein
MGSARLFSDDIRLTAKGISYGLQHGLLRPQLLLHQLSLDLFAELLKQPWRRWIVDRVPPPKIAETCGRSFFRRFRHGASLRCRRSRAYRARYRQEDNKLCRFALFYLEKLDAFKKLIQTKVQNAFFVNLNSLI